MKNLVKYKIVPLNHYCIVLYCSTCRTVVPKTFAPHLRTNIEFSGQPDRFFQFLLHLS